MSHENCFGEYFLWAYHSNRHADGAAGERVGWLAKQAPAAVAYPKKQLLSGVEYLEPSTGFRISRMTLHSKVCCRVGSIVVV